MSIAIPESAKALMKSIEVNRDPGPCS